MLASPNGSEGAILRLRNSEWGLSKIGKIRHLARQTGLG